jgi:hypothetical protein
MICYKVISLSLDKKMIRRIEAGSRFPVLISPYLIPHTA